MYCYASSILGCRSSLLRLIKSKHFIEYNKIAEIASIHSIIYVQHNELSETIFFQKQEELWAISTQQLSQCACMPIMAQFDTNQLHLSPTLYVSMTVKILLKNVKPNILYESERDS